MNRLTGLLLPLTVATSAVGCKGNAAGNSPSPTAAWSSAVVALAPSTPAVPPAAPSTPSSATQTGTEAKTAIVDFGAPGPVVVDPPIVLKKDQGGLHAKPVGWAKDSSELAACAEADGTGALECRFLKPGGKPELVTDFSQDTGVDPGKTHAIKARLAARAYAVSAIDWPYASQLTLTWKSACDQDKSTCVLRAGATIKGEEASYPVFVEAKNMLGMHAEAIALSPDAKWLGVIAHSAGGEGGNRFDLRIVAVTTFVGQIYNDAGFVHHKKGQFERSAQLFRLALTADPQNKLAFYNYACALGKQQAPGTEAALKAAIDVGGVTVKKRAAKDTDFAPVATADWFVALTR